MRILSISEELREGLACAASLSLRGYDSLHVQLGSRFIIDKLKVQLDTGITTVEYIEIPISFAKNYTILLQQLIKEKFLEGLSIVVTSHTRLSFHLAQNLSQINNLPLILRISDLGMIGKFKEAIILFNWGQAIFELPVAFLHLEKTIKKGDIIISHTAAIYNFLESYLHRKSILIYPTYAKKVPKDQKTTIEMIDHIKSKIDLKEPIVLGLTMISRRGLAGKHDKKVLECLYLIAKYNPDITVLVIGTEYNESLKVLEKLCNLPNLKFLGKIFNDFVLEYLYKKASLVVIPFFFTKTITNRLLEALFYGKPILTSSYLKEDFPVLKHGENVYMFNRIDEIPHLVRYMLRSDNILDYLEKNAIDTWKKIFSDKIFGRKISAILRYISI
ncbi:MAG: glycosyltransferase [Thermofilaceae archaeon]